MPPTVLRADSLPSPEHPSAAAPEIPRNLNAITIFQGLPINVANPANPCAATLNPATAAALGYLPNQQQFQALNFPQSVFLNQNYLNPSTFQPLGFQPFGYPQSKNFVYAYSQQANLTVERDLGDGFALSLAYNFNGGRHLNRPINANTIRGDLMVANYESAYYDALAGALPTPASPFTVSGCSPGGTATSPFPYVDASLMNFFRPGGLNPSIIGAYASVGDPFGCIAQAAAFVSSIPGFNSTCNPTTFSGCVPFGDMDANFSNGSSIYHGFSANLRKRFGSHYEFLASYTWSHSIDDSTDLQSTLTPQDSYFPENDRSTSLFDQRHRFVFSGVYQTGKIARPRRRRESLQRLDLRSARGNCIGTSLQHPHRQRRQSAAFVSHQPSQHDHRSRLRHAGSLKVLAQRNFPGSLHQRIRRNRKGSDAVAA